MFRCTWQLVEGQKKAEVSRTIEIEVASSADEDIVKNFQVHTVRKPYSNAKNVSRTLVESYPHLKSIAEKSHLSAGVVDLLIGTDFVDAFVDIHTASGYPGEPVAKRNCFGWYVLGQVDQDSKRVWNQTSRCCNCKCCRRHKETHSLRRPKSQTDATVWWKCSAQEHVFESSLSLDYAGGQKSTSQKVMERN